MSRPYDGLSSRDIPRDGREHQTPPCRPVKAFVTTRLRPFPNCNECCVRLRRIHDRKRIFPHIVAGSGQAIRALAPKLTALSLFSNIGRRIAGSGYGEYLPLDWQQSTADVGASSTFSTHAPSLVITPFHFPLRPCAHKWPPPCSGCSMCSSRLRRRSPALLLAEVIQQA